MINETKYGVISDVHGDPRIIHPAIDILKQLGAEKLLVNGDIGSSQDQIAYTLDSIGKSDLESYVQPGSHETLKDYITLMPHLSAKYPNIIDVINSSSKIEAQEHDLVFLPGSDFLCGGEFQIGNDDDLETGLYQTNKGHMFYQNINDLKKLVTEPDKTIVVCHVPQRFEDIDTCVDMAYFAEKKDGSLMPGIVVENMIKQQAGGDVPYDMIKLVAQQNGFTLKHENRGNQGLKELYEELGITKAVSGHFHESGHRANDIAGNHVQEGEQVTELFWNSGYLDVGQTGILTVSDGRISYQNVQLNDYV